MFSYFIYLSFPKVIAGIIEMEGRRFAFFTSDSVVPGIDTKKGMQVDTV